MLCMLSKDPTQRLTDILENIQAIGDFTAGMTFEYYVSDRKTVYAVTRALEIISEASRHLPDELQHRHRAIDWVGIAAVGNIYRHAYDVVDNTLVWYTIQHELTPLREAVEEELHRLEGPISTGCA
jgi:uncharacterized protein with HEPN domain